MQLVNENLPADSIMDELRGTNCYEEWDVKELQYFFCRYEEHLAKEAGQQFSNEQWNRIWESSNAKDSIEHISPQSKQQTYTHCLGNLLIFPPGLNSRLGNKSPKDKAQTYADTGLLAAREVSKQIAETNRWGKQKIIDRENKLLEWAKQEWSD